MLVAEFAAILLDRGGAPRDDGVVDSSDAVMARGSRISAWPPAGTVGVPNLPVPGRHYPPHMHGRETHESPRPAGDVD